MPHTGPSPSSPNQFLPIAVASHAGPITAPATSRSEVADVPNVGGTDPHERSKL
jgi:hypothetical protein